MQTNKTYPVSIHINDIQLAAYLNIPSAAKAIVIFAHGSGSSRHSPRNQHVAQILNQAHFATLLIDLLTQEEANLDQATAELRFDIEMLAERLIGATEWVKTNPATQHLKIAYLGASTGAAAALIAAAQLPNDIIAVISRGGRPDLAGDQLTKVKTPTLLIVGGNDKSVLRLNQRAQQKLQAINKITIIPHTTHLFPEPGALEKTAELAKEWLLKWLKLN